MDFKNFRLQIILRTLGIVLTVIGLAWSIYETKFLMTPLVFGLATIIQMIALIYYNEWTLREIKRFFDSFIDSDYTRRFEQSEKGNAFNQLGSAFNKIVEDFSKIRIEKEEHYQYLLQVNKHVNVGILCFTGAGKIDLMNSAACDLMNKQALNEMNMVHNFAPEFHDLLMDLKSGEKMMYKCDFGAGKIDLAISANKFKLGIKDYTLISLQNIKSELDAQEMQAWQKLIRVLTHEIMNSVTPVVSLTTAVKRLMEDESGSAKLISELQQEQGDDIYKSINAIEKRGKGLLKFVNAYRDYAKVPVPELVEVNLADVVKDVLLILGSSLKHIKVEISTSNEFAQCEFDPNLIEQVLINLIKNATEALAEMESPQIEIKVDSSIPSISVIDNGPGITAENLEEIFVPFFTTKKQGNGIGLSLSKQIMKAHKGDITVESDSTGTTFTLKF